MYKLTLSKKTGFQVLDAFKPVVIRDLRGIMFYSTEPLVPKVQAFNLPEGQYMVESGSFRERENPVDYKMAVLPTTKRRFNRPVDFDITFGDNKNKCTIDWDNKHIHFSNELLELPIPYLFFVLYHEHGHSLYKEETLADQWAGNEMKRKGFNPSQIAIAPIMTLSNRRPERKINMAESIIRSNGV